MIPADRIALLRMMGVHVALAPDGEHLDVTGPVALLGALSPKLMKERAHLVEYLRSQHHSPRSVQRCAETVGIVRFDGLSVQQQTSARNRGGNSGS